MELHPSILTGSHTVAKHQLEQIVADGRLPVVQIDVIDGWFADNSTLTPVDFVDLSFGFLQADFHLMTEEPMDYVFELLEIKEKLPIRAVIGQIERMSKIPVFVEQVMQSGWKVGLSLDLFTPVESITAEVLSKLDYIQIMSIEAGFQGQAFVESSLEKVAALQKIKLEKQLSFEIIIDGGIKAAHIHRLELLGLSAAVIGSGLWRGDRYSESLTTLLNELSAE